MSQPLIYVDTSAGGRPPGRLSPARPTLAELKTFDLNQHFTEIGRLENEGDRITREALAALFAKGIDPMVVICWKDIFERMEQAVDACEHAANLLEGICLEHS